MNIEKQIHKWRDSGVISDKQAKQMLHDVQVKGKEERSNKFIVAISTIGAILLGVGAILFIASNWEAMSDLVKVIILIVSTFGACIVGYYFKYQSKTLPKVGAALIFLATLLFGASIFLIAQIYDINANSHSLILIWLIGVLPLAYAFRSQVIASLSAVLFLVWIGFYIFRDISFSEYIAVMLPVIYVIAGLLLFSLGGLHYFSNKLKKIARVYRIGGIQIAMLSLYLMTFSIFSDYDKALDPGFLTEVPQKIIFGILIFSILSILGLVINIFFNPLKIKSNAVENGTSLAILGLILLFLFFPLENIYTLFFNLTFAGLNIFLLYFGYHKADIKLINIGIFWVSLFIIAKYFDFFWDLMPRSLFFLVGGAVLVLGGIALEKKRREIKNNFNKTNIYSKQS
jgi:uncharacterized membrane protein